MRPLRLEWKGRHERDEMSEGKVPKRRRAFFLNSIITANILPAELYCGWQLSPTSAARWLIKLTCWGRLRDRNHWMCVCACVCGPQLITALPDEFQVIYWLVPFTQAKGWKPEPPWKLPSLKKWNVTSSIQHTQQRNWIPPPCCLPVCQEVTDGVIQE